MSRSKKGHPTRVCRIEAEDPGVRIEVLDGNLRGVPLPCDLGAVTVDLRPGVYVLRFHKSGKFVEQLATVPPGEGVLHFDASRRNALEFASAAPVYGTTTHHEWHSKPAVQLSREAAIALPGMKKNGGASLMLFDRDPLDSAEEGALEARVSLRTLRGRSLFDLSDERVASGKQWRGTHLELDPGIYLLRRELEGGGHLDQMIPACAQWQTHVFLMGAAGAGHESPLAAVSVLMTRRGEGFEPGRKDLRWTESALRALTTAGARGGISTSLERVMLSGKFRNPMLGIYTALLHLRRAEIRDRLMANIFISLYRLVGPLPDVLAIGWDLTRRGVPDFTVERMVQEFNSPRHLKAPPMLHESARALNRAEAHFEGSEVVVVPPDSLADRVEGGLGGVGAWLCWSQLRPVERGVFGASAPAVGTSGTAGFGSAANALSGVLMPGGPMDLFGARRSATPGAPAMGWGLDLDLGLLSRRLADTPGLVRSLRTGSFTERERAVAYYLCPELEPQFEALSRSNRAVADSLAQERADRIAGGLDKLAAGMGLSPRTVARVASRLMAKLFAKRELPTPANLGNFRAMLASRTPDRECTEHLLNIADVPLAHPVLPRKLKFLEAHYLLNKSPEAVNVEALTKACEQGLAALPEDARNLLKDALRHRER